MKYLLLNEAAVTTHGLQQNTAKTQNVLCENKY